jgi:hypothetical protein
MTWGRIFRNAIARGEDSGYAAWLADLWEKRLLRKAHLLPTGENNARD